MTAASQAIRRSERYLIKQEITGGHCWRTSIKTPANVRSFVAEKLTKANIQPTGASAENLAKLSIWDTVSGCHLLKNVEIQPKAAGAENLSKLIIWEKVSERQNLGKPLIQQKAFRRQNLIKPKFRKKIIRPKSQQNSEIYCENLRKPHIGTTPTFLMIKALAR